VEGYNESLNPVSFIGNTSLQFNPIGMNMIRMSGHFTTPVGLGKNFKNKTEVYNFLRLYPGLNVPDYK
jgi:hypothetical protein